MTVADGPERQPGTAALQKPAGGGNQDEGQIDQSVLAEEYRADHRHIGETGNIELRQFEAGHAEKRLADHCRRTQPEQSQRQARRHLIGGKVDDQNAERHGNHGTGNCRDHHPDRGRSRQVCRGETADGPGDHHPFNAKIENAGAFNDEFTNRCQQQRRCGGDDRQDNGGDDAGVNHEHSSLDRQHPAWHPPGGRI